MFAAFHVWFTAVNGMFAAFHVEKIEVNKYYFSNQNIIRWLDGTDKIISRNQYAIQTKKLLSLWKEAASKK